MENFGVGDKVVYPSHGVGEIVGIENQKIADLSVSMYLISFPQDKMTIKIPTGKAVQSGLRNLCKRSKIDDVYAIMQKKPKRNSKMWSRRAQEYESKINSGDLLSIAEVVRDLYKNVESDCSYSERSIYEIAINRLASEISILENSPEQEIILKLTELLRDTMDAA
ncbi:CarD family transcriptional regulator [Rickettsia endosymbiont of Cardiosporidium cionae]|uniref:CarD family transcriptional regulator n=1 Tax=Rickettsia endosymbiont of Cardiosporidium cionae TaxID=2777155 RepID=UPI0018955A58|nr:CarD family transcriptional regulator [Rickettsia endosymbiont of Cardiosporidium cionae]KAF8818300.1 CarD family transcriptional regulator [Rickettsia endosymbiont of Cardiosporidium cionae]